MLEKCTEAITGWLFYDCISIHFSMSGYLLSAQRNTEKRELYSDKCVFLSLQSSSFNGQQNWEAGGHCLALHVGPYKLAVISKILQLGCSIRLDISLLNCYIHCDLPDEHILQ